MKNILALIGLFTVTFVALGWYLGWYRVEKTSADNGKSSIKIDVDTSKINSDLKRGVERSGEIIESIREKNGERTSTSKSSPITDGKEGIIEGWKPITNNIPNEDSRFNLRPIPSPR